MYFKFPEIDKRGDQRRSSLLTLFYTSVTKVLFQMVTVMLPCIMGGGLPVVGDGGSLDSITYIGLKYVMVV
jgi:hypothetical protein